jgi:hypothetical protein
MRIRREPDYAPARNEDLFCVPRRSLPPEVVRYPSDRPAADAGRGSCGSPGDGAGPPPPGAAAPDQSALPGAGASGLLRGGRTLRRDLPAPLTHRSVLARLLPSCGGSFALLRRAQLHAFTPGLGEADRDRLFPRFGRALPAFELTHLFPHERPGLRARFLALARRAARLLFGCFGRHSTHH